MGATPKAPDLKVIRGYTEAGSIVWIDGREKLVGQDWKRRVRELHERAQGRCEKIVDTQTNERCRAPMKDAHHVTKRSVLRDDRISNLLGLCRRHHDLLDNRKVRSDRAERRTK